MKIWQAGLLALITFFVTWFITDQYYKNQEMPFFSLKESSNPQYAFDQTTFTCKPNLRNGNCSQALEQNYNYVIKTLDNRCNQKIQTAVQGMGDKAKEILSNALNNAPTSNLHYENTNCRTDPFTGQLNCTSFGN